jgi:hypothetical protein
VPRTPSQAEDTVTRPPTPQPVGKATPGSGVKPLVPSPAGSGSRPPVSVAKRAAILTPATGSPSRPSPGPKRRSSMEETPLPRPVPYHVHDPTTSANKVPREEVADHLPHAEGDPTRPGGEPDEQRDITGLAQAARRISGLINPDLLSVDVAAELDTRQRPRLEPKDLDKISQPPPTVPIEMIDEHDLPTPPPGQRSAGRRQGRARGAARRHIPRCRSATRRAIRRPISTRSPTACARAIPTRN